MKDNLHLFLQFLRSPLAVGAVAPSSRILARAMLERIPFQPGRTIIELGPGTGAFTREIACRMPAGMRYIGIEKQQRFVDLLRRRYPNMTFIRGNAEHLPELLAKEKLPAPNDVISGLPFAWLPPSVSERILNVTREVLAPLGGFTTFQYVHAYPLPTGRWFRRRMFDLYGAQVTKRMVWRNLPPAFVLRWTTPS